MPRLCLLVTLGMFAMAATALDPVSDKSKIQYEVLSPWAEVDPIPLKGISPRVETLSGRKIGLFANYKRAAVPIATALKTKLETSFPDAEVSLYHSNQWNVIEADTENKEHFTEWAKGMDAVILAVGD